MSVKLARKKPLDYSKLTRKQFDAEMEKGLADLNAGRTMPSKVVKEGIRRKNKP